MGKLFPPFKVDIAGALCVPFTLRDARTVSYTHLQRPSAEVSVP